MNTYHTEKTEKRESRNLGRSYQIGVGWTLGGHFVLPATHTSFSPTLLTGKRTRCSRRVDCEVLRFALVGLWVFQGRRLLLGAVKELDNQAQCDLARRFKTFLAAGGIGQRAPGKAVAIPCLMVGEERASKNMIMALIVCFIHRFPFHIIAEGAALEDAVSPTLEEESNILATMGADKRVESYVLSAKWTGRAVASYQGRE
jgi:hypothetical protein